MFYFLLKAAFGIISHCLRAALLAVSISKFCPFILRKMQKGESEVDNCFDFSLVIMANGHFITDSNVA